MTQGIKGTVRPRLSSAPVSDIGLQQTLFPVEQTQITTDDRYTPRWVFEVLGLEYDLDVAAPPGGVPWIPAAQHFSKADDGLSQPWHGRVWMNPPYSEPGPWVSRFSDHHHGVAVLPGNKSGWFHRLWHDTDAAFCYCPLDFVTGEDIATAGPFPVFLVAYGDECVDALGRIGTVRAL